MTGKTKTDKTEIVREMLLKALKKNPDLFSYYVSIMEAKELLGKKDFEPNLKKSQTINIKKLGDL